VCRFSVVHHGSSPVVATSRESLQGVVTHCDPGRLAPTVHRAPRQVPQKSRKPGSVAPGLQAQLSTRRVYHTRQVFLRDVSPSEKLRAISFTQISPKQFARTRASSSSLSKKRAQFSPATLLLEGSRAQVCAPPSLPPTTPPQAVIPRPVRRVEGSAVPCNSASHV
jgi:hypothetical protein